MLILNTAWFRGHPREASLRPWTPWGPARGGWVKMGRRGDTPIQASRITPGSQAVTQGDTWPSDPSTSGRESPGWVWERGDPQTAS